MADELIRLDKTIIGIDRLIAKASTAEEAKVLFTVKDVIYSQQIHCLSCPLIKFRSGKNCEELSPEQISEIMRRSRLNDILPRTLADRA